MARRGLREVAMIHARADVIGSLLRPGWLLDARERWARGELDGVTFKRIEDRAVDAAVALQEAAGVDVVTDGEMRRLSFQSQLAAAVEGFEDWDLDAFVWGNWHGGAEVGDWQRERPSDLAVITPLRRRRSLSAEEFVYLRGRTACMPKVTLPSPGLFANFWSPERSTGAYASLEDFLGDVATILRDEVLELAEYGARYIQLDAPHYPLLIDPQTRAFYEARGWTIAEWLDLGVTLDNRVMAPIEGVTFGLHLCRGNQASRWLVSGGYDAIAEPIFANTAADRLLLEYDDERSGGFEPLEAVPADKTVVLGLVSSKHGRLEEADELIRCIDAASTYVDRERLALSTQCGFGTSVLGNQLTIDEQAAKLRLVADVARRVWG
jgi:5-methyltetrahydropteroyltriglutamate--homocysteine methyltransferase